MKRLPVTQIEPAVAVDVDQRRGVSLRPGVVDDPLGPLAVRPLLEPEHAEVVSGGGDDVVAAVAVDVEHVHEPELGDARRGGGLGGGAPAAGSRGVTGTFTDSHAG